MIQFCKEDLYMNFGDRILQLRNQNNVSQPELAAVLHVGRTTISNYETNYSKPDIETLVKIADYFNVSIDYLLGHSNEKYRELENDEQNVLAYYSRLDDEDKNYIKGLMIQLFREKTEQKKSKKIIG